MVKNKKIAIAISNRGRKDVLEKSVYHWQKHYPEAEIIVVEDNDVIARGISKTKNICIDKLINTDAYHCFLSDDDIYPTDSLGLYRYVNSPYKHMSYSFEGISREVFVKAVINKHNIFNSPCGCLLYCTKDVLLSGIRYNTVFKVWGMEHKAFSVEIRRKGFTPYYFIDIVNSDRHFYSYDQHKNIESSVPEHVRISEIKRNTMLFNQYYGKL